MPLLYYFFYITFDLPIHVSLRRTSSLPGPLKNTNSSLETLSYTGVGSQIALPVSGLCKCVNVCRSDAYYSW